MDALGAWLGLGLVLLAYAAGLALFGFVVYGMILAAMLHWAAAVIVGVMLTFLLGCVWRAWLDRDY